VIGKKPRWFSELIFSDLVLIIILGKNGGYVFISALLIDMGITAFLRKYPQAIFSPYSANLVLYGWLLAHGARSNGVFISALTSFGALGFIFLCVRGGFVMGGQGIVSVEKEPRSFWVWMIFAFVIYLVFTYGSVAIYLQDKGG